MFTFHKSEFLNFTYRVQEINPGAKHMLTVTGVIKYKKMLRDFVYIPIPTNEYNFSITTRAILEKDRIVKGVSDLKVHYPNFPIVCIPIEVNSTRVFPFGCTITYTPFRTDLFWIPTLEGYLEEFDPDKEVYCKNMIYMKAFGLGWQHKKFDGWYTNADTVAPVEHIKAGLWDSINMRPLWDVWH